MRLQSDPQTAARLAGAQTPPRAYVESGRGASAVGRSRGCPAAPLNARVAARPTSARPKSSTGALACMQSYHDTRLPVSSQRLPDQV